MTLATLALIAALGPWSAQPAAGATGNYLLMPRAELLARPTTGTAWTALKAVADGAFSTPNLCDQNSKHHLQTLAAALVYARTGIASYATKAQAAIMAALPTQVVGCNNAVLALGRQLTAYVLAADLSSLRTSSSGPAFATWLSAIRTKNIGGHSIWYSIKGTHENSPNNWGAYAGAARIAADLYLGDTTDLAAAAKVTQGFLGDRTAYAGFNKNLSSAALSWSCSGAATYTPVNWACFKSGINVNGGVVSDISRGGSLRWPPADPGIPYQLDSISGSRAPGRAPLPGGLHDGLELVVERPQADGRDRHPFGRVRRRGLERDAHGPPDAVAAEQALRARPADEGLRHGPGHRLHRLDLGPVGRRSEPDTRCPAQTQAGPGSDSPRSG